MRYRIITTENPYRWGAGRMLFDALSALNSFSISDLTEIAAQAIASGEMATLRDPDSIAWGFHETARGFGIVETV